MAERNELVVALAGEVLGPRGGVYERLETPPHRAGQAVTPLDEYITGVLAPRDAVPREEIDATDDLLGEADESADDQVDAGSPALPPATLAAGVSRSPCLDPRSRPSSIGLSIVVHGARPQLDVCTTWAWYVQAGETAWQREPKHDVWTGLDCTRPREVRDVLEPDGVRRVSVELRSRQAGNAWHVSIFLINTTRVDRPGPEHHVYQPQIRIRTAAGTHLVPLDDGPASDDAEAESLALLYSRRRALARGHLCAAVWSEIDPEGPFDGSRPAAPPFAWPDGSILAADVLRRFSAPDARTELVPCYAIGSPQLGATERHGTAGFDPEQLSELWDPTDIRTTLSPLADAYEDWISTKQQELGRLPARHQRSGVNHLQLCRDMLRRMRDGIDLLCNDADVRLAFCFANKAIAVQSRWTRRRVVPWRPFQLAFQLVNLPALRDFRSPERLTCDLLWIPTGGGKTEAYLGLAAFTLGLRRVLARRTGEPGGGVAVLSRYTLRLLTIQQFRRALALVTACEVLRIERTGGNTGWRPRRYPDASNGLWGGERFSIGLWVGGSVTPNGLFDFTYKTASNRPETVHGALSILKGQQGEGEPAQVLSCPCCGAVLAVPPEGFAHDRQATLHFVLECAAPSAPLTAASFSGPPMPRTDGQQGSVPLFAVTHVSANTHPSTNYHTVTITFIPSRDVTPQDVDHWGRNQVLSAFGHRSRYVCARPSRPGYFLRTAPFQGGRQNEVDFEIFCPNPECQLNSSDAWTEATPSGNAYIPEAFEIRPGESSHIPIPALTVDEQVYQRCPSIVVATADKFARLAFEPRAASLFGRVDHYCERYGYYRAGCPPTRSMPSGPIDHPPGVVPVRVRPFNPPDLILQDELHLIDGPLGSMVGIYETVVETLASRTVAGSLSRPKYIASSATVRRASEQVRSLYDRKLAQFPPPGLDIDDNFFTLGREAHPLESGQPGRLYVGICAPGRGAQTPIVRIWSRLLQHAEERRRAGVPAAELDGLWTLVGYFNAIRELAGAVALARQDIPERMAFISPAPRRFPEDEPMELSGRMSSLELPGKLDRLYVSLASGTPVGVVATTSMFGTGVDVPRLGLMCVNGQPKTTSSYIQATGRVGRERGGLVVTFYRASRPRDLSHYEFFTGYHRELYRHVEPITVNPFSARARDRALGPASVALLRQATELWSGAVATRILRPWHVQQRHQRGWRSSAGDMAAAQMAPEVTALQNVFESRALIQPPGRRPQPGVVSAEQAAEIARWAQLAAIAGQDLLYYESSMISQPTRMVVLGDLAHEALGLPVAYENAPNSLRDVEPTTTFKGRT